MDLQQTVQDLAEAWVAASTDTSFRRTQLQVYGSGSQEETKEGGDLSTADDEDIDVDPTMTASSLPHAVISGGDGSGPSHSRKRKQSTPLQRREGMESERSAASLAVATSPALKGSSLLMKKPKQEEGKMLPVHCVVEILETHPTSQKKGEKDDDVEGDEEGKKGAESKKKEGYAIVPATLQLRDLVRVALAKLDYTPEKAKNATGVIQVRNWKALPFSAITDNVQSSVGQLFGDLLSHITLKITILSSDTDGTLNHQPSNTDSQSNNPLSHRKAGSNFGTTLCLRNFNLSAKALLRRGLELPFGMMARRTKGGGGGGAGGLEGASRGAGRAFASHEVRIKLLQLLEKKGPTLLVSHGCPFSQITVSQILQGKYGKAISNEKMQAFYQWFNIYNGLIDNTLLPADKVDSASLPRINSRHWRRPRTLFNPRTELPRLLRWYRQNPRPSRSEMEVYLAELNSTEFRRSGTPLQYSSIMIWFKNARVKYRHLLRSSAIAQMREDLKYASSRSSDGLGDVDESKESDYEDGDDNIILEEREEEHDEGRKEDDDVPLSLAKSPARSSAKSPARSPAKSPLVQVHVKEEPPIDMDERDTSSHEDHHQQTVTSMAKPVILPSLLHMQARPHLQPVSIVSNGLIVPSRLHNGVHQPEAALQVPDLRKIASGFGISLTPEMAAAAHRMPMPGMVHPHYLHTLELMQKESPSMCPDYHNGALSVPKPSPGPGPLTNPSASARRTPPSAQQPSKAQSETPKHAKSPQSSSDSQTTPVPRAPRKRFTIDPTFEVPKLQAWFAIDPRPDRHTIERYVRELNSSEWRRHQPKYNNRVVYVWFKNARAKYSKLHLSSSDHENRNELARLAHEAQMS